MQGRNCIVVMAREPLPGSTKTRLAAALGDRAAAALYEAFLLDTLATCGCVDARLLVSYAPDSPGAARYFRDIVPEAMLVAQPDAPFGARLASAMQSAFDNGYERVAIIGSDIPHMESVWLDDAFASLDDHDVALGPTQDGGYYLLALRTPEPRLFDDIEWSSGRELGQTRICAGQLGLRVKDVDRTFDIDNIADLSALQELIRAKGADACPRTAAAFARLNLTESSSVETPVR
jgi:rSAM/selenodomain-associated transferase 1